MSRALGAALLVLGLGGCQAFKGWFDIGGDTGDVGGDGGGDDDGGSGGDGGSDGGSGDGGSGSGDGGSGGGDGGDADCDDPPAPEDREGPDCVTREISCGESFEATIEGGTSVMTGDAYQSWYCEVVGSSSYAGTERVYEFYHPGTGNATISLDSPCANLDLFAAYWTSDSCPTAENSILECEGSIDSGDDSITIWNNEERRYLVVVDGPYGDEEAFGLSVSCE